MAQGFRVVQVHRDGNTDVRIQEWQEGCVETAVGILKHHGRMERRSGCTR